MRISVIIPIYNVAPYIEDCLKSVMVQTMTEGVECILVDDCGADNSIELAEKLINGYNGEIKFSVLHHEHNRGLSAARNTGMSAAQGEYIYFLDSDDEIFPHTLETLHNATYIEKFDVVVGNYMLSGTKALSSGLHIPDGTIYRGQEIIHSLNRSLWYRMAVNKLYNRRWLSEQKLIFCEGIITEDELWTFNIACQARSLYISDSVTYNYKCREGSIFTSSRLQRFIESKRIIQSQATSFIISQNYTTNSEVLKWFDTTAMVYLRYCGQLSSEYWEEQYVWIHKICPFNRYFIIRSCLVNPRYLGATFHLAFSANYGKKTLSVIDKLRRFASPPSNVVGQRGVTKK